nr:ribonuclease H-like domain-containing protein [Tanacetum cinerariifolium]
MALPEDHLAKFHKMADAKEMWEAIKSRFGGNDESKKMQKYLLKQQFEGFSVSASEGLHKGYDRFQTLLTQLEIHGTGVSHEDADQKYLRSLPSSWSQVALIMRTKPWLDTLSFDDLYNNLRVFERDVKGTTASSSSNIQNVAFVSADNTSSTNDVNTAYSVSLPFVSKSYKEGSSSYTNEVIHSFFANQSSAPQMNYDDLQQINNDDMEEIDLKRPKWNASIGTKWGILLETAELNGIKTAEKEMLGTMETKLIDNGRRPVYQDDSKALVTINGEDIDWSGHVEEDIQNYAMMAYSSSNPGSDNEFGLGYGDYRYGSILSYENEVLHSVFMNKECDLEDSPVNDRYAKGMHAVPLPMTGNYMPSGPDVEIDYSKFTYDPKQTSVDELDAKTSENATCESDSSVETTTSMPATVKITPKVVSEPKVWTDAPIIEEYESDSDDDLVSNVQEEKEKPSFAFTDTAKHVKTSRENVKETSTPNHCPKVEKHGRHSHSRKGLGYAFTKKSCFDCGSFSHLKRDYEFHEKRMAKQAELATSMTKDDPHKALKDKGIFDSGCSRHMTGNKAHLVDYLEFKGGSIAFGRGNRRITGKGKIKTGRLDFEDVYHVEEIKHYNLFSVSQMCDKKNKVLFTDTNCFVLSPNFKLPDENQVLLKIPRQHNMYSFNLKNIDPSRYLSWLFAKASIDESYKWHRRLGHVNFKNLNKLVKGNLVKGLPSKIFENDHTCVTCQKGKQNKASCMAKTAEAVNTACYVLNRILVTKPQINTPYELLTSRQPIISYLRPFGCHVTILNTIDQLGMFDGKSDSGFLVGYSLNSRAFRVYNLETNKVEENLHVNFLENKPNVVEKEHAWMFDLANLTNSLNYEHVSLEKQANKAAGPSEANNSTGIGYNCGYLLKRRKVLVVPGMPKLNLSRNEQEANDALRKEAIHDSLDANTNTAKLLNAVSAPVSAVGPSRALNDAEPSYPNDPSMPYLEDIFASPSEGIFINSSYDDEGVVTDFNNLETTVNFQIQKVWILVDLPFGKKAIGTKWFYRNKKDEMEVVVRNKARLVAQRHRQKEGIDYDEVFAPVARIEAIRIFLAFASYMGFLVYQMDVKSAFLYGLIDKEVYVTQPPSFVDPKFPNKVYKVVKALYGLHQAPRGGYRRGAIDKTLFI